MKVVKVSMALSCYDLGAVECALFHAVAQYFHSLGQPFPQGQLSSFGLGRAHPIVASDCMIAGVCALLMRLQEFVRDGQLASRSAVHFWTAYLNQTD